MPTYFLNGKEIDSENYEQVEENLHIQLRKAVSDCDVKKVSETLDIASCYANDVHQKINQSVSQVLNAIFTDQEGDNPFHWIVANDPKMSTKVENIKEIIPVLVSRGIDINKIDNVGFTPLCLLCEQMFGCQNADIASVMLQNGALPNIPNIQYNYQAPIHFASANFNSPLIKTLLQHGAVHDMRDKVCHTPYGIARGTFKDQFKKTVQDECKISGELEDTRATYSLPVIKDLLNSNDLDTIMTGFALSGVDVNTMLAMAAEYNQVVFRSLHSGPLKELNLNDVLKTAAGLGFANAIKEIVAVAGISAIDISSKQLMREARAQVIKGCIPEAIKKCTDAIVLCPTLAHAYSFRGFCELKIGEKDKADADFKKASELEPKLAGQKRPASPRREESIAKKSRTTV